jgi:hypothetical protein
MTALEQALHKLRRFSTSLARSAVGTKLRPRPLACVDQQLRRRLGRSPGLGGEGGELRLDDAATGAGDLGEGGTVQQVHVPAVVLDEPVGLQLARDLGDGRAADTEHLGQEVLGEQEPVAADPVAGGEQPARRTLFGAVGLVAGHLLAELDDGGLGEPAQQGVQVVVLGEEVVQVRGGEPGRPPGDLAERVLDRLGALLRRLSSLPVHTAEPGPSGRKSR